MNAGIPLADAVELRRRARPARLLTATLAAAAIGCAVAALVVARSPGTRTLVPLGRRASAVLVLDLSASISPDTFSRIAGTLRTLSSGSGRFALVVFSDLAYEALPPGTPAADLAPLIRFFTIPRQGDSQVGSSFPPNPWADELHRRDIDLVRHGARAADRPRPASAPDGHPRQRSRRHARRPARAGRRAGRRPSRRRAGSRRRPEPGARGCRVLRSGPRARRADHLRAHARAGAAAGADAVPVGADCARAARGRRARACARAGRPSSTGGRREPCEGAAAVALAALAVLSALLAADVRAWPAAIDARATPSTRSIRQAHSGRRRRALAASPGRCSERKATSQSAALSRPTTRRSPSSRRSPTRR